MSEPLNQASQTSLHNSLVSMGADMSGAPPLSEVDPFRAAPTGKQADTAFLSQPYNENWPQALQDEWEKFNMLGIGTTPAEMAKDMTESLKAERNAAADAMKERAQANAPQAQAELQGKMATTAAAQLELQEAYRQEVEYQRSLATINDPNATSAKWNAARMQMEGLASSIGKRINPKGGTSQTAMKETKNAVGYIGSLEAKNPFADFTPRIDTMLRGSQERMGLLRQQMEAAKVPVPEIKPPEVATQEGMRAKTSDMVMSMAGIKDQSGNVVMIGNSPVIKVPEAGKPVYKKRGPGGGWINLTQEEVASLGAQ